MEIVEVKKVRAIVLRNGKILVTNSKNSGAVMLPGGKIEKNEMIKDAICREILEETGIEIESSEIQEPFFEYKTTYLGLDKNGNEVLKKVQTYFYEIRTKQDINFDKISLTEQEKERGSIPYWINPQILEYKLLSQKNKYKNVYSKRNAEEILNAYNIFFKNQKKENNEIKER